MRATDVMTSEVTTVHEDTSVHTAAQLMAERGISALPVVDRDNRVIGMVSEGDLLHRAETGTERRRSLTSRFCSKPIGSSECRFCATASSSGSSAGRTSCERWR